MKNSKNSKNQNDLKPTLMMFKVFEMAINAMQKRKIQFEFELTETNVSIDYVCSEAELKWMFAFMLSKDIETNEKYYLDLLGEKQFNKMSDGVLSICILLSSIMLKEKGLIDKS